MTDKMVVFVSCDGKGQAEKIAAAVIEERLAACVNVMPSMWSCYVWEKKLTWAEEVLLVIKTSSEMFAALETRVRQLHSYDVPEIVGVPVEAGSAPYLKWVGESVGGS